MRFVTKTEPDPFPVFHRHVKGKQEDYDGGLDWYLIFYSTIAGTFNDYFIWKLAVCSCLEKL